MGTYGSIQVCKINKSAQEALEQIDEKGYMIPHTADGGKLVKRDISFSTKTRTIEKWTIKEMQKTIPFKYKKSNPNGLLFLNIIPSPLPS